MLTQPCKNLVQNIVDADLAKARAEIDRFVNEHGTKKSVTDLLQPTLTKIGIMWGKDTCLNLAQGYLAAKIAEEVMEKAVDYHTESERGRGPVVIGNIEDDYHALGRKMVVAFLRSEGWEVIDLGNDVPAVEFVDKAEEVGAPIIGVSAMTYSNARNIPKVREEIDRRGLTGRVQLAVGGAVFVCRPDLVEKLGGDGTAENAIMASALMENLCTRSAEANNSEARD